MRRRLRIEPLLLGAREVHVAVETVGVPRVGAGSARGALALRLVHGAELSRGGRSASRKGGRLAGPH